MNKSKSKGSENQFKQFVDQKTHDQTAQIQRNWRIKIKQQKNKIATRVLIVAIIVIGLIFAIAFNFFISHKYNHLILASPDGYTYVQTNFPNLKVLIDDQFSTYETKMVKGLGMVFGELVAWVEGNVVSDWKVLLVPNELSGTGMLAVALGYNLNGLQGGRLDILANSESYKKMILKNIQLIKNEGQHGFSVNFINRLEDIGDAYDLFVVENNNFYISYPLDRFKRVVEVRKIKWDTNAVRTYITNQFKHEIVKGRTNDELRSMGELYGYSLVPLASSDKDEYKTVIFNKNNDPTLNICPQTLSQFKTANQLRNLVEFMRNKYLANSGVFYGLDSVETLQMLVNFNVNQIYSDLKFTSDFDGKIRKVASFNTIISSKNNYYILTASTAATITTLPLGKILIYVKNQSEFQEIINKFSEKNNVWQLPSININGCFYPPRPFLASKSSFYRPSFLILDGPWQQK